MPWLFLVVSVVGLAFTILALYPPRHSPLLVSATFLSSLLTGELAAHHLAWQAALTVVLVWMGALEDWPGWVALGITLVSWAGLVGLLWEASKAGGVVERALVTALGPTYRDEIDPDLRERLDEGLTWRQRLFPLPVRDARVELTAAIPYKRAGGRTLCLDVYRSKDASAYPGPRPTLVQVHGGAWIVGRRDQQALPLMLRLAAHGWVCVAPSYRLSPFATFPDHVIDVKDALRWVRDHAAEHGMDPAFVVITGGSAGGHLSSLTALTPGDPALQPGFEGADTSVSACVPIYGVYDFTDRKGLWKQSPLGPILERYVMKRFLVDEPEAFDRASPMSRVHPDAPPFFVVHGTRDTLVPIDEARNFVEVLSAESVAPVAYAELPGAQHAFELFPSLRTGHVIRGIERFLTWVYSRHREQTAR